MKNSDFYNIDLCAKEVYNIINKLNKFINENKNKKVDEAQIIDGVNIINKELPIIGAMYMLFNKELLENNNITIEYIKKVLVDKLDKTIDSYSMNLVTQEVINNFNDNINQLKEINNETFSNS